MSFVDSMQNIVNNSDRKHETSLVDTKLANISFVCENLQCLIGGTNIKFSETLLQLPQVNAR